MKFYEKGDRPLEIVTSRQWFIKTMDAREALLARGRELGWHPTYMQARLENWINGLAGDWCISRQRFFGVPFPVWYKVREDGTVDHDARLLPTESRLPIDPSTDVPDGYTAEQRDQPGGFSGDPDIMDTWATSSLSPQIAGGWIEDPDLFARVFPMDVRPQAHDIIRTWLFSTMLRAEYETGLVAVEERRDLRLGARSRPQEDVEVEGQRRDADGAPRGARFGRRPLLGGERPARRRHGLRFRPDEGRPPPRDQAAQRVQVRPGQARTQGAVTSGVDRGLLTNLARLVRESTEDLENYQYTRVLERTETAFWFFCDNYLELVKSRRYGDHGEELAASANTALLTALSVFLRLFAPFLPFATEEVWSWWQTGSVHKAAWPTEAEILGGGRRRRQSRRPGPADGRTGAWRHSQEEVRGTARAQDPGGAIVVRAPEDKLELLPTSNATCARRG